MSRYKWSYKFNVLGWNFIKNFLTNFCIGLLIASLTDTLPLLNINVKMLDVENRTIGNLFNGHINNISTRSHNPSTDYAIRGSTTPFNLRYLNNENEMNVSTPFANSTVDSARKMDDAHLSFDLINKTSFGKQNVRDSKHTLDRGRKLTLPNTYTSANFSTICLNKTKQTDLNISLGLNELVNVTLERDCNESDIYTTINMQQTPANLTEIMPDGYVTPTTENYTVNIPTATTFSRHSDILLENMSTNAFEGEIHGVERKIIYIGGLFELSGSRIERLGLSELTSARLAVDHINRVNFLKGYTLGLLHNDTRCDPGVAVDALYDLIYRRQQLLMVMGSACSEVTKTLAEIVPYWNLILVSFASTSPALSEREKYKTFFRLAPADSSKNIPRTMFIQHFSWDTVATLYESNDDFSLAMGEMGNAFHQHNITIKVSMSFRTSENIGEKLQELKDEDIRVIVGGFSENVARKVLCEAFKLDMYGSRYVWMMIGDYVKRWWELANDTECTRSQLAKAAEGYFTIDSLSTLSEDDMSTANISLRDFEQGYERYNGTRPLSPYATSTYDTVWTIARTLRKASELWGKGPSGNGNYRLESFNYERGEEMRKMFFNTMQNLGFLGISGPISFEGPDRKGISVINQNQGGHMRPIALYEPGGEKLNFYCRMCEPIIWQGGRAPRDKYVLVPRPKKIEPMAYFCVSSVSFVGLMIAAAFLAYNLYHRRLRYIKLSSPKLNNVAVIGCMLVYSGIIILGFDESFLEDSYYLAICTIRAFLFAAGFSLAFGAMFTKTYRVHQIFTRANRGLIKSKLLRDKQLLFIIGALLVVDSAVVLVWVFVDPMHKQITNLTTEASENDEDLLFISQLTTCNSAHIEKWTGALYAYKGLLLIFGVYMAWETRHVKIPALNDSQYIGMNVYNVVIMSIIVVVLSNILSHQPTLAYVMESSFMLLSTTVTLCLLFLPKIYAIITSKGNPIIAASGIQVDANCRRFVVDERRDQYYRAEVQNRVYKREIVELDQEISRLERLLEIPIEPYPRLTEELLFLLPESRVDPTPTTKRRRLQEKDMCNSISDAGDICMGVSDEKSDDEFMLRYAVKQPSPKPLRRRANRLSVRVTNYAVSKLNKIRRPRFSIGSVNFKTDYEDLKGIPSPDGDQPTVADMLTGRNRFSHPLIRQKAVEERKDFAFMTGKQSSSEKSDTRTFESILSDNSTDATTVQDHPNAQRHSVAVCMKEYLDVPSIRFNGCEFEANVNTQRRRKYGHTLEVPSQDCKITPVDMFYLEEDSPKMRRARSIIEHERRTRIRKLQNDLENIQRELKDLDELEYEVSEV